MTPSAPSYTTRESHAGVLAGIEASIEIARDRDRVRGNAPSVSAWSVKDQLEHLLLADRAILTWIGAGLSGSPLADRVGYPNDIGVHILDAGSIPRGRGPAPKFAMPTDIEVERLVAGLERLRASTAALEGRLDEVDANLQTRPHHLLGDLTPAEWLRFLHIHHLHHEGIIRDILAA